MKHTPPVETAAFELHVPSRYVTLFASDKSPWAKAEDARESAEMARWSRDSMVGIEV